MRRFIGLVFGLIIISASVFGLLNYQLVVDHVVASQYKPSGAIVSLIKQDQLSAQGEFLLRATQAKLDGTHSFNQHCHKKDNASIVLGCYIGPQQIYIYDVSDSRLVGIKQVTTAHEMLHAAYDRLSISERKKVNEMIDTALPSVLQSSTDLADRLIIYEKTEPGERYNELHSILGSEAEALPAALEEYYKKYFKNRQVVTNFATTYSKIFNDLKANQDALLAELTALNTEINALSDDYNVKIEQLNNDIDSFNARADTEGAFSSEAEFNAARNLLLQRRNALEAERELINSKISYYQTKQKELEALNVEVEDLNSKLDSTKLPSL